MDLIETIACEAECHADQIVDQGGEFHTTYTEKFAQLLLNECLIIIEQSEGDIDYACFRIREKFGV